MTRIKVSFNMEPCRFAKLQALAEKKHIPIPTLCLEIVDSWIVTQQDKAKSFRMPDTHYHDRNWVDPL